MPVPDCVTLAQLLRRPARCALVKSVASFEIGFEALDPTTRNVGNRILHKSICWIILLVACEQMNAQAEDIWSRTEDNFVPAEGRAYRRRSSKTLEQCESACAADTRCKAYSFRTARPACYFYPKVYMLSKSARRAGLYSSGLSIVPKPGFVSAFKRSSFPPRPVMGAEPPQIRTRPSSK